MFDSRTYKNWQNDNKNIIFRANDVPINFFLNFTGSLTVSIHDEKREKILTLLTLHTVDYDIFSSG